MVILIIVLLGLCLGSFINAAVWRLHEQAKTKKQRTKSKELSILRGRYVCTHCYHTLSWYDLLPVVSWIILKGRCRYCHKPISWQYPVVELATAVLFVFSYSYWPYGMDTVGIIQFGLWLVFLTGFMALTIYDLRWMILPNKIVFPLLALASVQTVLLSVLHHDFQIIISALSGLFVAGGLFYVLFRISEGKWIGGGDVKLGFILGLLAGGFIEGLMVIFIASLLGTIFSLPMVSLKKQSLKKRVPFGPFLIIALIIVYLFSADISNWFQLQLFLL